MNEFNLTGKIRNMEPKLLAGFRVSMSFAMNRTGELWKKFMQQRAKIAHGIGTDRYSVQVYQENFFDGLDETTLFEKWAAVEVSDDANLPADLEILHLPGGLHAVFHYKGSSANGDDVFRYIFTEWIPASGYALDHRPHFEVLGDQYRNGDDQSEEEIWIPVRTTEKLNA